ncbi:MAG: flagellar basal-body rod protein FlgF [Thermodesulfobacterium geofontis]|uniref:Flagellar basal-body rod protein FlgF n=1 Tax=Thermodesulfobacterium geofontis TaxID=1295609 RepID=A0A2N7PQ52_9BACT|nr:MAG: flagellar basal-body rod protein FlgF [Thermodesulfobacterium geofontis]PMP94345.1 MAG: flagellar basal-body rod protein FlgF [Thermodesulfobacterium geofontis]
MGEIRINPHLGLLEALEAAQLMDRRLTVTVNNLANVDTPGYKADNIAFIEVLMKKIGPKYKKIYKETQPFIRKEQGILEYTGDPLHLAIVGEGFFKIQTPNGIAYTRAGNFTLDTQRRLVTPEGYPVLANGTPVIVDPGMTREGYITMENSKLQVSPEGILSIDMTEIGRLDVVTFNDYSKLKKLGENLYISEGAQERVAENYEIKQGYIEKSNVNVIREMANLIEIHRTFEAVQRSIKSLDEETERLITTAQR